jgi:predicted ATP-dependent protease
MTSVTNHVYFKSPHYSKEEYKEFIKSYTDNDYEVALNVLARYFMSRGVEVEAVNEKNIAHLIGKEFKHYVGRKAVPYLIRIAAQYAERNQHKPFSLKDYRGIIIKQIGSAMAGDK